MIRSILVAVDYSAASLGAMNYAANLAREFGSKLCAVHVWDCPSYARDVKVVHSDTNVHRSLIDLVVENAEREMTEFANAAKLPAGVQLETRLLSGDASHRIVELAQSGEFDLIVMATHGRSGLPFLLLGSVAERVVRLSPIPVLTLRGGQRLGSSVEQQRAPSE